MKKEEMIKKHKKELKELMKIQRKEIADFLNGKKIQQKKNYFINFRVLKI